MYIYSIRAFTPKASPSFSLLFLLFSSFLFPLVVSPFSRQIRPLKATGVACDPPVPKEGRERLKPLPETGFILAGREREGDKGRKEGRGHFARTI